MSLVKSEPNYGVLKTENTSNESNSEDGEPVPHSKKKTRAARASVVRKKKTNTFKRKEDQQMICVKGSASRTQIFNCNMQAVNFPSIQINEVQGYCIKLELVEVEEESALVERQTSTLTKGPYIDPMTRKVVRCGDFQFSFNPIFKKFVRELIDEENMDPIIDKEYLNVKRINNSRTNGKEHLTLMKHLYNQKLKFEAKEKIIVDGDFIEEVDAYSEETHSDLIDFDDEDRPQGKRKASVSQMRSGKTVQLEHGELGQSNGSGVAHSQKRINELINSRYMPQIESVEMMYSRIQEINEIMKEKMKVGESIKTFRITEGEIVLNEEVSGMFLMKNSEISPVEDEEKPEEESEEEEGGSSKAFLKSRKLFAAQINERAVPTSVKYLQYTANVVMLGFIILSIIEYTTAKSELEDISTNFQAIQNRFQLVSEMQRSAYHIRSIVLDKNATALARADMLSSLNSIYTLQSWINLQRLEVFPEHESILNDKSIPMYFRAQSAAQNIQAINFSLTEGLLQLSSSLFTLTNLPSAQFSDSEDDVFFYMYNNFQDTLNAMFTSANLYVIEFFTRTGSVNQAYQTIFYLSIGCILLSVVMLIPVVHHVGKTKQQFLESFLELDNANLRKLSSKCEKYINTMQDDANDDLNSNDEDLEGIARTNSMESTEDEYSMSTGKRSKKKRAKNSITSKNIFIIKFVVGMLIIEVYFFANFFTHQSFLKTCNVLGNELNVTANVEPFFWFGLNAQRQLYALPQWPILDQQPFNVALKAVGQVQKLAQDLQKQHLEHESQASTSYNTIYSNAMYNSVCTSIDNLTFFNNTGTTCEKFISQSTTQGLQSVIARYQENLRKVLTNYQKVNVSTLLASQELQELFFMQRFLISSSMETIVQSLQDSVQSSIASNLETRLSIFTLFIIAIILLFVIVWIPFINGLSTEVHKTKSLLLLIPIELLASLKNLGSLLKIDKRTDSAEADSQEDPKGDSAI